MMQSPLSCKTYSLFLPDLLPPPHLATISVTKVKSQHNLTTDVLDLLREKKLYTSKRMQELASKYEQELGDYTQTGFWIKSVEQKFG